MAALTWMTPPNRAEAPVNRPADTRAMNAAALAYIIQSHPQAHVGFGVDCTFASITLSDFSFPHRRVTIV